MALRNIGYVKKEVELRTLTIAELKLEIVKRYTARGEFEVELIDITSGDIEVFKNLDDVLNNEWCGDTKIDLLGLPHTYGTKEDYKSVVLFQISEDCIIK